MTTNDRTAIINDRYELSKRIGRGGMADVFLGRDRLLDRQVAIKVLFPEFAVDPNFVERFRREAQAAANLSHPNIVSVFDWGKHSGTYFIAMEYVHGRTLADILRTNGRVTAKQAGEIASEVAAALNFAHEAGLVHRDIKPANILIGANGQVKVADFGIARAMNATDANLTQAGAVMGTATYFSPEQAQGAQPDPRSDLYSLGIVMYEMVAGKPPFTGENPVGIAYKQVHDHPQPLNQIVADVPRPYEAIVAKLLAKDPKVRYATANAVRDDLRRFRNGDQVLALAAAAGAARPAVTGATAVMTSGAATVPMAAATGSQRTVTQGQQPPNGMPTGASPQARYYEPPPSRTGWYALAAFFALVALGIGGVLLFNALSGDDAPGSNALKDYVGMSLDDAIADLDALGLAYSPVPEENTSVPENVVHRTDPQAGMIVVEGQTVKLFYNPPKELQPVPNVEGQPLADAQRILSSAGFQISDAPVFEENADIAENSVIRTDPAADARVAADTVITLYVSSGPDQQAMPPIIVGQTADAARAFLEAPPYSFRVTVTEEETTEVNPGIVIRTNPTGGTLVDVGGQVTLVVSSGAPSAEVPDVVGMSEPEARSALAEFDVSATPQDLPAGDGNDGRVTGQSVNPGQRAPIGSRVTITVGRAAAPTTTAATTTTTSTTTTTTTTTTAPPATAAP